MAVVVAEEVDFLEAKPVQKSEHLNEKSLSLTPGKAFRNRATGRNYNRDQPTEGGGQDGYGNRPGRERGPGTRRVGRGAGGPRRGGDRHSRTGVT